MDYGVTNSCTWLNQLSTCTCPMHHGSVFDYLFIYVAVLGLSCSLQDLSLWHAGSSSMTRDQTQAPCSKSTVLAAGPPGRFLHVSFERQASFGNCWSGKKPQHLSVLARKNLGSQSSLDTPCVLGWVSKKINWQYRNKLAVRSKWTETCGLSHLRDPPKSRCRKMKGYISI